MRIYWHSTVPWGPSSYSVLTKRTVPEIVRLGHEVVIGTWYGLQGQPQDWRIRKRGSNGQNPEYAGVVKVMPCLNGATYGVDIFLDTYRFIGAEVAITCMDVWVLPPDMTQHVKFAPWLPVDHDPIPPGVIASCRPAIYPMCYSRWGTELLQKANVDAHYVPCSADATVYRPMPREEARAKLGVPADAEFIVSMVAANKDPADRKGLAVAITAFAEFKKTHEGARLYVHTNWGGPVNIQNLCRVLGLQPIKDVWAPDLLAYHMGLLDDEYMRAVYSMSDVLLNPALSEGFGLPILEAQMCGCPAICTDFSTTDELLFAGWRVKGQRHWSIGAESFRVLASVESIVEALEAAYADRGNELVRKQARAGAIAYDTEEVARRYWAPALRDIEDIVTGAGSAGELKMVTF